MNQGTWQTLLVAVFLFVTTSTRATEPLSSRSITQVTQVSEAFRQEVELASRTIPDNVWHAVRQSGWRVRVAEFVVDAAPSLRNRQPRGWPSDATWNNTDAVHLPKKKLLVLAEKRRTTSGRVVASSRVPGVLRHEFGHAFDISLGGRYRARSATPEFVSSYQKDVDNLTVSQRNQLAYYLQDQRAGRQETFAEAFAILLGGGSDTTKRERFSASFPHVLQYVSQAIEPNEEVRR
jgi:hypothetical protein